MESNSDDWRERKKRRWRWREKYEHVCLCRSDAEPKKCAWRMGFWDEGNTQDVIKKGKNRERPFQINNLTFWNSAQFSANRHPTHPRRCCHRRRWFRLISCICETCKRMSFSIRERNRKSAATRARNIFLMKIATNKCFDSTSFYAGIAWKLLFFFSASALPALHIIRVHVWAYVLQCRTSFLFQFLIIIHEIGFVSKTNQNLLANTTFTSYLLQCRRYCTLLSLILSARLFLAVPIQTSEQTCEQECFLYSVWSRVSHIFPADNMQRKYTHIRSCAPAS